MLKVDIYAGPLKTSSMFSRVAWLDIAYEKLDCIADYKTVLFIGGIGALDQRVLRKYPRWSGSLWDLVLRCILISHNQHLVTTADVLPEEELTDKNFAFAETISASISHYPGGREKVVRQIGHCEIRMGKKGQYEASFEEHAGTPKTASTFLYRPKTMYPSLLLAHAICAADTGDSNTVPIAPVFMPPPQISIKSEKEKFFDLQFIHEPLQTGLRSFLQSKKLEKHPASTKRQELYPMSQFWTFVNSYV